MRPGLRSCRFDPHNRLGSLGRVLSVMFLATTGAHDFGILFCQLLQESGKRRIAVRAQKINFIVAHVLILAQLIRAPHNCAHIFDDSLAKGLERWSRGAYCTRFCTQLFWGRIPLGPAKRSISKKWASLSTTCPHCGHEISLAEIRGPDFHHVLCPRCEVSFIPGSQSRMWA
jgi:hypothetical protein